MTNIDTAHTPAHPQVDATRVLRFYVGYREANHLTRNGLRNLHLEVATRVLGVAAQERHDSATDEIVHLMARQLSDLALAYRDVNNGSNEGCQDFILEIFNRAVVEAMG